jgi:hypothetical protein
MPSKKVYVRDYTVRAHDRTIHTRNYQLICQLAGSVHLRVLPLMFDKLSFDWMV